MTGKKGNRIGIFMGKEGQGKIFLGRLQGSMCMATTGWGLIYFNLFNLFKIHNLHTSLPPSSRSAWHPHSSRPFVICCTAQSTFLPISCFPALSPLKLGRGALFPASPASLCQSWLRQSRETNLCQFSRGRPAEFPSIFSVGKKQEKENP